MVNKNITISIPEKVLGEIEKKVKETGFDSMSDYLIYILKQVVSKKETKYEKERVYTKEEEEQMKKRLEESGYL